MSKRETTFEEFRIKFYEDYNLFNTIKDLRSKQKHGHTQTFDTAMVMILGIGERGNRWKGKYLEIVKQEGTWGQAVSNSLGVRENRKIPKHISSIIDGLDRKNIGVSDFEKWFNKEFKEVDDLKKDKILGSVKDIINGSSIFFNHREAHMIGDRKNLKEDIIDLIDNDIKQIIINGAPGTGKTYIVKEVAREYGGELTWEKAYDDPDKNDAGHPFYKLVQFHPSYDYVDFIEGLRPVEIEISSSPGEEKPTAISIKKMDGIFKWFCRNVVRYGDEDKTYFFIIDEINRADLPKVFGELMYGLEKDKRGVKHKISTQYQNLKTYIPKESGIAHDIFEHGFYIPENVVILATMNDIDRSVETIDFALRRRFEWKELVVTKELLIDAFKATQEEDGTKKFIFGECIGTNAEVLATKIMALNEYIEKEGKKFDLNKHYYISQGYFANLPEKQDIKELITYVWQYRIKSTLYEYVRGEEASEVDSFIENCGEKLGVQTVEQNVNQGEGNGEDGNNDKGE